MPKNLPKELAWATLFLLFTLILTWPIAITMDQATCIRGDYFGNIWNAWWMRTALFEEGSSPYWTDYLHYPDGISLGRHTLSPVSSITGGLLGYALGPHATFNGVLLLHFALSGWSCFLLARFLTGSALGAVLAGLIYSFNPFHYYYLAQINVATLEFLPLAILFFLKTYRDGGVRNVVGMVVFVGLLAASSNYYLVYALITALLLLLGGKLWEPRVRFLAGARRLAVAGLICGVAVLAIAWPLVSAALGGSTVGAVGVQEARVNDLFGYRWLGGPEILTVSWPTMLGYSTLLLLILGIRSVVRQRFWLLVGVVFLILGWGTELTIHGRASGILLPYRLLADLPVLSMLRKADRCFAMIQFTVAILAAFAWVGLSGKIREGARHGVFGGTVLLILLETAAVPFARFEYSVSPYLSELAESPEIETLVELPANPGLYVEGRYNFSQVHHRKKMPQGYTTSLALTATHRQNYEKWWNAYRSMSAGRSAPLAELIRQAGIDAVVLHKTITANRKPILESHQTLWAPFLFVGRDLVKIRQLGPIQDVPIQKRVLEAQRREMTKLYGLPIFEDDRILVFRAPS